MQIIKLIPENQTLDECINIFRQSLLNIGYNNSSRIDIFLITKEKFEYFWNILFFDKDEPDLYEKKKTWENLIENKRVIVANSDNNIIDTIGNL